MQSPVLQDSSAMFIVSVLITVYILMLFLEAFDNNKKIHYLFHHSLQLWMTISISRGYFLSSVEKIESSIESFLMTSSFILIPFIIILYKNVWMNFPLLQTIFEKRTNHRDQNTWKVIAAYFHDIKLGNKSLIFIFMDILMATFA